MTTRSKYGNRRTVVDGLTFDSMKEAKRWRELRILQSAGAIDSLQRQVPIELVPGVKLAGDDRARPAIRLVVDFKYQDRMGRGWIYEDAKGLETSESRMKRHLAKALHGIDVVLA